jgi:hypothetical protein
MKQRGEFPRRFFLTSRCVVWDLAEVEAWIEEHRRASDAASIQRASTPDVFLRLRAGDAYHDALDVSAEVAAGAVIVSERDDCPFSVGDQVRLIAGQQRPEIRAGMSAPMRDRGLSDHDGAYTAHPHPVWKPQDGFGGPTQFELVS